MAVRNQILAYLASVEGKSIFSQEKKAAAIQRAGLTPSGGQGGGSGAVHWQSDHLALTALAIAASSPSSAVQDVRLVDSLPYAGSRPAGLPAPGGHHCGSALGYTFEKMALRLSRGEVLTQESEAMVKSWTLTLCNDTDVPYAQLTIADDTGRTAYFFHNGILKEAPVRRLTILSGEVLLGFIKLLADTYIHENSIKAIQFLDASKLAKLGQEDESAGDHLRQEAGPALSSDRPPATGSDSVNAADATRGRGNSQGCDSPGRDGQDSKTELDLLPS